MKRKQSFKMTPKAYKEYQRKRKDMADVFSGKIIIDANQINSDYNKIYGIDKEINKRLGNLPRLNETWEQKMNREAETMMENEESN